MSDEKSWAELAIEQIEIGYKRIELLEAERDEWKDVAERRQLEIERMSIYKNKLLHASESTLTPHKIFTSDRIVSVADALANYPNGLMTLEESRESTQAPHKVKPEHPIEPGYNYHYAGEKIQSGWECLQNDGKEWALTDFAGHTIGETGTGTVYRSKKPVKQDEPPAEREFKVGDIVICVQAGGVPDFLSLHKIYVLRELRYYKSTGKSEIVVNGNSCSWQQSRFRHATPAEITEFISKEQGEE